MCSPIVLLTDFGYLDPYVGQMKGVILRHAPGVPLVDLCHEVEPGNVDQAAFMLQAGYAFFPENSIFVCVVDPGVGTARKILLARLREQFFLAPDNGLLNFLGNEGVSWWVVRADRPAVNTFHGRDIFAPLAARLSLGEAPHNLGTPMIPGPPAPLPSSGRSDPDILACVVRHVDRFGNCLLDVHISALPRTGRTWRMGRRIVLEVDTYAELPPGRIGLIPGSQGVMELAMNQKSCAQVLGLRPGSKVLLLRKREERS
jgi:S-adenosylmethionine hydrolase